MIFTELNKYFNAYPLEYKHFILTMNYGVSIPDSH